MQDLGAATHVRKSVSRCFAALRQLRLFHRYVTDDRFRRLVVSLIHSRLDFGNFTSVALYQPIFSDSSSLYSTLQLIWCSDFDATTSLTPLQSWQRVPRPSFGHDASSTEWFVSAIPGSASSPCWSAWSSSSALILITSAAGFRHIV